MRGVRVEQAPDDPLILRVVLARLVLEELDAAPAQRDSDLDAVLTEHQILRARKEVRNDARVTSGSVRIFH
jgi:hypothetical protein